MKKVIDSAWFSEFGSPACIGIVVIEDDETNERRAYIGNARGWNQQNDEQHIVENGARFWLSIPARISGLLSEDDIDGKLTCTCAQHAPWQAGENFCSMCGGQKPIICEVQP